MRYYGFYRAFVVKNDDPLQCKRLILKIPQIYEDAVHEYWAYPFGIFAGTDIGLVAVPNVGDMVWVSFENGPCLSYLDIRTFWKRRYF